MESALLHQFAEKAIDQFIFRRNNPVKLIDAKDGVIISIPPGIQNASMHAGSAMIYYCELCGWPTEFRTEGYCILNSKNFPRRICSECQDLLDGHWMEQAQAKARAIR